MPYKNITFIKLLWKDLLHEDDRFIERLDDSQKGVYLMLLLLAGATNNNIRNDENSIKRILNLHENSQNIRKNIDKICDTFPKLISKNGFLKFKNFSKIHNYIRNSQGTTKEILGHSKGLPRIDKNRLDKIRIEYIQAKGWENTKLFPDDFARIHKAIINLVGKTESDELAIECIHWMATQGYEWTLETCIKKYPDFLKHKEKKAIEKEFEKNA